MPASALPAKRRRSPAGGDRAAAAAARPAAAHPASGGAGASAAPVPAAAGAPAPTVAKHLLSCIDWPVSGAVAVAASPDARLLATGRADGSIELRVVAPGRCDTPVASVVRPPVLGAGGAAEALAVSALKFAAPDGVVAARMDGSVEIFRVVDGHFLERRCRLEMPGGAVWDVAVHGGRTIAVACDDHYVRVISARGSPGTGFPTDPVDYEVRTLARGYSRVLCVTFADSCGRTVASGDGKGMIRWMDVKSGKCVATGRLRGDVRVWCLVSARGGRELIAGDSTGRVSTWDSRTGVLFDELRLAGMEGDIMTLAHVVSDGPNLDETVLVAGASGAVGALVSPPSMRPGDRWLPVRPRRLHSHDIRSLAILQAPAKGAQASFVTASLDTTLSVAPVGSLVHDKSNFEAERLRPFSSPSIQPHLQFISRQRVIVARYPAHVDLWRVNASAAPSLLCRLSLASMAPNIRLCAVSHSLRLVAVAAPNSARVFQIDPMHGEDVPFSGKIAPVHSIHANDLRVRPGSKVGNGGGVAIYKALLNSVDMVFLGREQILVVIRAGARSLAVCSGLAPSKGGKETDALPGPAVQSLSMQDLGCATGTRQLIRVVASPGISARCAVSDSSGRIAVVDVADSGQDGKPGAPNVGLSCDVKGVVLGMCFSRDGGRLAISTSLGTCLVLDVPSGFKHVLKMPAQYCSTSTCLSFTPNGQAVVFSGSEHCLVAPVVSGKRRRASQPDEPQGDSAGDVHPGSKTGSDEGEGSRPAKRTRRSTLWREKYESGPSRQVHKHLGFHENILGTCMIGEGEVVVVNRPWEMVLPTLPRAMKRKVFGS